MQISKKLLFFYLSKSACLDYSISMSSALENENPDVFVNRSNKSSFPNHNSSFHIPSNALLLICYVPIFALRLFRLLRKYALNSIPVVLYSPSFHPLNLILAIAARIYKLPYFITVHDYESHLGEENKTVEFIQKLCIKLSSNSIFLSDHERSKALIDGFEKNKLMLIPHPVLQITHKHSLEHSPNLTVLFLGRIRKYKGIEILIEAAKELPQFKFTIAGDGDWTELQSFPSNIACIRKKLTEEEISQLLLNHHVLVLPYVNASQSGILSLGLGTNIPMIITTQGGLVEQINADSALWIKPETIEIIEALKSISYSKQTYKTLKEELEKEKYYRINIFNEKLDSLKSYLFLHQ